ncbi:MAG: cytochrome c oxidase assembly protein [Aquihabitans sp.]
MAAVVGLASWWVLRGRHNDAIVAAKKGAPAAAPIAGSSKGRTAAFVVGVIGLYAVIDWPLATLGAGYLATAQMIRQVSMVMIIAPLLLFACPPALAVRLVGWGRRLTVLRWMSRPIFAVPVAALSLIMVNAPAIVDPLVKTPYGSMLLDGIWIIAGFTLWMPVQCPHPGVRRLVGPAALAYLIGQSIVPVLPGFFMTWADFPIYATYELAPRVFQGFDAVDDQQTAAAILQVGGMVLLWIQITYRFLKWGMAEMEQDRPAKKTISDVGVPVS